MVNRLMSTPLFHIDLLDLVNRSSCSDIYPTALVMREGKQGFRFKIDNCIEEQYYILYFNKTAFHTKHVVQNRIIRVIVVVSAGRVPANEENCSDGCLFLPQSQRSWYGGSIILKY